MGPAQGPTVVLMGGWGTNGALHPSHPSLLPVGGFHLLYMSLVFILCWNKAAVLSTYPGQSVRLVLLVYGLWFDQSYEKYAKDFSYVTRLMDTVPHPKGGSKRHVCLWSFIYCFRKSLNHSIYISGHLNSIGGATASSSLTAFLVSHIQNLKSSKFTFKTKPDLDNIQDLHWSYIRGSHHLAESLLLYSLYIWVKMLVLWGFFLNLFSFWVVSFAGIGQRSWGNGQLL